MSYVRKVLMGAPDTSRVGLLNSLPEETGLAEPLHRPRKTTADGTLHIRKHDAPPLLTSPPSRT